MDPAALGTALIGLEAIRSREADEASERAPRIRARQRPRLVAFRAALAGTLRALADALEPGPHGAAHRA